MLSGTMELYDGSHWIGGGQEDFPYVAPGAPREHYFEGLAQLGDLTDDERRTWFEANDDFFVE